jgi:hypothetical protein
MNSNTTNWNGTQYGKDAAPPEMPAYGGRLPMPPYAASGVPCAEAQGMARADMGAAGMTEMAPADRNGGVAAQGPPAARDMNYLAGYLSQQLGRRVLAEFVVGTNSFLDKTGVLRSVGANYFVLEDFITRAMTLCDLYSVKFITVL